MPPSSGAFQLVDTITSRSDGHTYRLLKRTTCTTRHVIYHILCPCAHPKDYVGSTQDFKVRWSNHKSDCRKLLGLGCNIFLVLRLWCYALPAIWRRLATAVAHLLYKDIMHGNCCDVYSAKEIIRLFLFFCFLSTVPDLKRDPSPPTHKKLLTPIFSLRNPKRKKQRFVL